MVLLALALAMSPFGHAANALAEPAATEASAPTDDPGDEPTASDPGEEEDDSSLRDGVPDEERLAEAGMAFSRGVEAFKQGRFEEAREQFAVAQRLAPHPDTLFNLGLAQQSTGRHQQAWESFDELLEQAADEQEREEILTAQSASRPHVAWLRVITHDPGPVCLDGAPLRRQGNETPRTLTSPGEHRVDIDRHHRRIELGGGESRVMELDIAPKPPPPPPKKALRVLSGFAVGGTVAAAGLGVSAALVDEQPARLGLGIGAGAAGTVALTQAIIILAIHRRARRYKPQAPLDRCPP